MPELSEKPGIFVERLLSVCKGCGEPIGSIQRRHYGGLCVECWTKTVKSTTGETGAMSGDDPVNHPKHYTSHPSGIECIQITRHMDFNLGNAIKYIWRCSLKAGLEDLQKALWYINDEIKMIQEIKAPQDNSKVATTLVLETPATRYNFLRPLDHGCKKMWRCGACSLVNSGSLSECANCVHGMIGTRFLADGGKLEAFLYDRFHYPNDIITNSET